MTLKSELLKAMAEVDAANPKSPMEVAQAGIVAFDFLYAKGRSLLASLEAFEKLHREHFNAEFAKDRDDATRYRHARDNHLAEMLAIYPTSDTSDVGLDAAIDAARAARGGG